MSSRKLSGLDIKEEYMEKVSDQEKRIELIKAFKEKVNRELDRILKNEMSYAESFCFDDIKDRYSDNYEEIKCISNKITICLFLREWIEEYSFLKSLYRNEKDDHIIYAISSRHLRLWLQKDYYFVESLIYKFVLATLIINDSMLEYDLTSVIEEAIFTKKEEEEGGR